MLLPEDLPLDSKRLLTSEEERTLCEKMRAGCVKSRNELVKRNIRWILSQARKVRLYHPHLQDDMEAYALYYVTKYMPQFDSSKGRLSTWISRAAFCAGICFNKHSICKERRTRQLPESLTATTRGDRRTDEEISIALSCLSDRERGVVVAYYLHGRIMEDIGRDMLLTRERVRQILVKSVDKMREALNVSVDQEDPRRDRRRRRYPNRNPRHRGRESQVGDRGTEGEED